MSETGSTPTTGTSNSSLNCPMLLNSISALPESRGVAD